MPNPIDSPAVESRGHPLLNDQSAAPDGPEPDRKPVLVETLIEPRRGWAPLNLRELWDHRDLLRFLVLRNLKVRYKQMVLGAAWAVIQPVMVMVVFTLVFGRLAGLSSDGSPYALFSLAALVPWMYFSNALTQASNSVVQNERLVTKVYFPRILVPLAAVMASLVDLAIAFVVLFGVTLAFGVLPDLELLLVPPLVLLVTVAALAAGTCLAALNVFYRDVRYAVAFLIQFWLFVSPVAYSSTIIPDAWRPLYALNPIAGVIDGFRWALLDDAPSPFPVSLHLRGERGNHADHRPLLLPARRGRVRRRRVSSGDVAIRVEGLSKRFRLGEGGPRGNLGETLSRAFARSLRRSTANAERRRAEYFWALSDVTFEVRQGEVLGIIGANGAGKSTLLKILSRITRPTAGRARVRGRVGALLEVGTGFHPELSGRDNVFLNGVVLGMNRHEIGRKFDDIVEFAGVERFLDTPVKRYSSGMAVRLGFAVAAHLEPDVLIVDEVLAVGDAEFQRKCLGKMDDVARAGRTIIFVSHNMNAVQRLCSRSLEIKHGRVVGEGPTREVVQRYLAESAPLNAAERLLDVAHLTRSGTGDVRVVGVSCAARPDEPGLQPYPDGPLEIGLLLESDTARSIGSLSVVLRDQLGTALVNADSLELGKSVRVEQGRTLVRLRIRALHLTPGIYVLGWSIADPLGAEFDVVERAIHVEVVDMPGTGLGGRSSTDGAVTCHFDVDTERADADDVQ